MSPFSWPVLLGTLVVGSPALRAVQTGTLSVDAALVRLLICLAGVWAVCSVVVSLSTQTVEANRMVARLAEERADDERPPAARPDASS